MSKAPLRFKSLGSMAPKGTGRGKVSITSRGVNGKQNASLGIKKKAVKANAVKGKSVVTRSSKMAKPTPSSNGNSYATVKVPNRTGKGVSSGKSTTPNNMTTRSNSPLNAVKPGRRYGTKAGMLASRPNPTNHMVGSPLKKSMSKKGPAQTSKPKNLYGYNGMYSPTS